MCARIITMVIAIALLFPSVALAHDSDGDGIEDEWEIIYGFDPLDPSDGTLDVDGDGLDNLAEFLGLTNPFVFDGPSAPSATSPLGGVETSASPTLLVGNATDPSADALLYSWEVYADSSLSSLVTSTDSVAEDASGQTGWQVDAVLTENTPYWWRARAHDPFVGGAWCVTSEFFVNAVNEAPTAPTPATPQDGELLPSLTPTVQLGGSTDPDGDGLTYAIEVWADAALTDPLTSATGLTDVGGLVEWTLDLAMDEDAWGWLRARATDEHGLAGPWTDPTSFHVSGDDAAPAGLVWGAPLDASVVETRSPTLVAGGATDAEGSEVLYAFEVANDAAWANSSTSDLLQVDEGGDARWDLAAAGVELAENEDAYARARASDGAIWSSWEAISFFVNSTNDAPGVPELVGPDEGTDIADVRPVDLVATWVADADRDPLEYAFVVARDEALFDVLASGSVPGNNTATDEDGEAVWELMEELEPGTFWWSAQAIDDAGLGSGFAEPRTIVVIEEETPTPSAGGYSFPDRVPRDGCNHSTGSRAPSVWWMPVLLLPALRRRR
jgi:MYXO-CTERM domain-containing protein